MTDFEWIFFASEQPQALLDLGMNLRVCNEVFVVCLGHTQESIKAKRFEYFFTPTDWQLFQDKLSEITKTNTPDDNRVCLLTTSFQNLAETWVQVDWKMSFNPKLNAILLISQKVTHIKEQSSTASYPSALSLEELLYEITQKQALLEAITQNIPAEVCSYSTKNKDYFFSNQYFAKLFNLEIDNLAVLEQALLDAFVLSEEKERFLLEKQALETHKIKMLSQEFNLKRKNQESKTFFVSIVPLDTKSIQPTEFVMLAQDVSLLRYTERLAHLSNDRLSKQNDYMRKTLGKLINSQRIIKGIADAVPVALQAYNVAKQSYLFNNNKLAAMLGYTVEEFERLFKDPLLENIYPEDRLYLLASRASILEKQRLHGEIRLKSKEGVYKWFDVNVVTLLNYKDEPYAVVTMLLDISEQKNYQSYIQATNASLKENQAYLEETLAELSNRNYELDQLVYKISHDLRAPLSSILGLVNIYKIEESAEKRDSYVSLIENRINKLDGFVKSMLNYAKANRSEIIAENIDFKQLISHCLEDFEYLESFSKVKIKTTIEPSAKVFKSDALRIKIIFNNIISNAFKYYNPNTKQAYLKIHAQINAQEAHIRFEDNGIGISEEYLERIFEMFFRGTSKSEGAGLGMYIVKQTLDRMGGTVKVASVLNRGTTFEIKLPNLAMP